MTRGEFALKCATHRPMPLEAASGLRVKPQLHCPFCIGSRPNLSRQGRVRPAPLECDASSLSILTPRKRNPVREVKRSVYPGRRRG